MKIHNLSVADLSNDPANARTHDERNVGAIVASLRRFGQQKPIVIDRNNVVRAGNGTLEAARLLGWETIACVRTDLMGSEAVAYAIADNRTAELAAWDDAVLAAQLNGLATEDADLLAAAGFTDEELEKLLGAFEIDAVEAPSLSDADREEFRQMTFTLHDSQYDVVDRAIKAAKSRGGSESSVNENSNGNALSMLAEAFLDGLG